MHLLHLITISHMLMIYLEKVLRSKFHFQNHHYFWCNRAPWLSYSRCQLPECLRQNHRLHVNLWYKPLPTSRPDIYFSVLGVLCLKSCQKPKKWSQRKNGKIKVLFLKEELWKNTQNSKRIFEDATRTVMSTSSSKPQIAFRIRRSSSGLVHSASCTCPLRGGFF